MRRAEVAVGSAERATSRDIPALNRLFSEAFTDRYRRDGMAGVRVPHLDPAIWEYAIANAGEGALVWRDNRGDIVAFNMIHCSGSEGWMGPLAVRTGRQGEQLGKRIVGDGLEWLKAAGAKTIGLETMPRTIENIGFYSRLGFRPQALTVTLQGVSTPFDVAEVERLGQLSPDRFESSLADCRELTESLSPGSDYTRESELTIKQGLGDVILVREGKDLVGFLVWHGVPLAKGRAAEELRILKLVARDRETAARGIAAASAQATGLRLPHVTLRCQGEQSGLYSELIDAGWRVQWTDLRMTHIDYPAVAVGGVVLTNWEI